MENDKRKLNSSRRTFLKTGTALATLASAPWSFTKNVSADGRILKVRSYFDQTSMDPAFSQGLADEYIHSCVYSKLIQYTPGNEWGWQLDAASHIEQVDDTHVKFKLRDDLYFSDGYGKVTAEDVKFSFERIVDEDLKSTNKPDWGPLLRVDVINDLEGVIVLKNAFQPLWNISLPYIVGNIVSKKAVEKAGGKIGTKAVACSGPYIHKSWQPKQKIILSRNPEWKGEPPVYDEIHIYPIDDEKTAEIAFAAGEIDFTKVSLASLSKLKTNKPKNSTLKLFPSLFYVWVGMNLENEKLKNKKLRQAIQYAIDVPSIMEASYFGEAKPSTGIIAPGLIGHRAKTLVPSSQNLSKAKKLLKESGMSDVQLTLDILNKSANVTTAQVVQANLAQIGITLEINLHEAATFWSLGDESAGDQWKNIELVLNRFSMLPDPYYASSWFTCEQKGVWNWERICNEELDRLHLQAQSESDEKKRGKMYQRIQDIMEESGAYRFLTHEANPFIYRNSIKPALRPDGSPLLRYFS